MLEAGGELFDESKSDISGAYRARLGAPRGAQHQFLASLLTDSNGSTQVVRTLDCVQKSVIAEHGGG